MAEDPGRAGRSTCRSRITTGLLVSLPGFGSTPPPESITMENYARLAGKLGCDVVVGYSLPIVSCALSLRYAS